MADEPEPQPDPARAMDRRTFVVKAAMGAAGIGAAGAMTAGLVVPLSTTRMKIRRFPYWGAKKVGGPAPQGIPLIPLKINAKGELEGVPELEGTEVKHNLDWYRYCGHEESPALKIDETSDNVLRYNYNRGKLETAKEQTPPGSIWYDGKANEPVLAADFPKLGDGAPFRWRSEDLDPKDRITGIVIRVDRTQMKGKPAEKFLAVKDDLAFIAFCSFCAHFCCVPGYKESNIPLEAGLFDKIYCTCHDSVYNPLEIKNYTFPPDF